MKMQRFVAGAVGTVILVGALSPPAERLATDLFAAHMVQHLSLMLVVPLLLAFATGRPSTLPARLGPGAAGSLFAAVMWVWHVPALYDAAVANVALHVLEHASFVGAGWFFWAVVLGRGRHTHLARLGLTFGTTLQSGALGALIAFASSPLYTAHLATTSVHGLTPLEDQQLAGALMWIPPGTLFLVAMLTLLFGLLKSFDRTERAVGEIR